MQSEKIDELLAALIEARHSFGKITYNQTAKIYSSRTNKSFEFPYANLAGILEQVEPHLYQHGLSVFHTVEQDAAGSSFVTCTLAHKSGQWIKSRVPHISSATKATEVGGWITYMRRYTLAAILGIVAEEEVEGDNLNDLVPDVRQPQTNNSDKKSFNLTKEELQVKYDELRHLVASYPQVGNGWEALRHQKGANLERLTLEEAPKYLAAAKRRVEEEVTRAK